MSWEISCCSVQENRGTRLAVSEGRDVVYVAAKNDDASFVREVFVETITFGHIR